MAKNLVAYIRVSTKKQGESGLGLEAQQAAVTAYAASCHGTIIAEAKEVETAKKATTANRPELAKALARCKLTGATLVVAKLDRLARNVAFTSALMESGVEFVACDMPHANRLTIHIMAAVAEDETRRISQRTKDALARFKAGKKIPKRYRELYGEDNVPAEIVAATAGKLGGQLPQCRNLTQADRLRGSRRGGEAMRRKAAERAALRQAVVG